MFPSVHVTKKTLSKSLLGASTIHLLNRHCLNTVYSSTASSLSIVVVYASSSVWSSSSVSSCRALETYKGLSSAQKSKSKANFFRLNFDWTLYTWKKPLGKLLKAGYAKLKKNIPAACKNLEIFVQKSCVYQCQFRLLKFWNTHTCRRTEVFLG